MKAKAKINAFLKILGLDDRKYHFISSRFILVDELYDELIFTKDKQNDGFEIISNFHCDDNIIEKAFNLLCNSGFKNELDEFFKIHSLKLIKNIPTCAGLGGGSSDAACFLKMMNEALNLKLSKNDLIKLSIKLGSDVAFFLSDFKSANVSGFGEIISEFDDDEFKFKLVFPDVKCETPLVYKEFDSLKDFVLDEKKIKLFEALKTRELFSFKNTVLNDLFTPCVSLYPKMSYFMNNGYFLSGSGSSVFEVLSEDNS
ncbi:4-(cytidine 5'-diphospho)-2-C-methyl-D-erythritol kinase [uncultured Campylobacter sp.]|uniref:4-(cytidine 5'-diphospho)-2-C-methyl-D-erythritol kinase n=1 Tax=uncultured Campylobacter sp. TaxID=218934 RepID=UPI00260F786F|nr:4-(cytidine 5'-diphospho)-2-C-methyl-D-erythritol kinase [uncultured Campylobacter sp.]